MQLPIKLDSRGGASLQAQLFDHLIGLISDGRLKPGMRMPASRQLADDLAVSRNTVVLVYERLLAEGLIEMRPPQGTFVAEYGASLLAPAQAEHIAAVRAQAAAAFARAPLHFHGELHAMGSPYAGELDFDFWVGRPDSRLFPSAIWRKLIEQTLEAMQHGEDGYGAPQGLLALREAVADHLGASRGIACHAADIVITQGIQEGLNIVARMLLGADVMIGMENPGYLGAANVFASYGATLVPVAVDEAGAVPHSLPPACRMVYLTPAHQYPTGVTLTSARRSEWLAWAQACNGYLIEDDYDSDFYYDGAPLQALRAADRNGAVIYLGTFSKSLAAGLRMGYLVVPPALQEAAAATKGLMSNGSPWLIQAALAAFVRNGDFAHHLRRLRKVYAGRRDALCRALRHHFGPATLSGDQAGMHVLWHSPQDLPEASAIESRGAAAGVGAYAAAHCNTWVQGEAASARARRALLFGYAALSEEEIAAGVARLAAAARG